MLEPYLRKYPLHDPVGERVVPISQEVVLVNHKVVVRIQLPEFAIDDVKVLVRKEPGTRTGTGSQTRPRQAPKFRHKRSRMHHSRMLQGCEAEVCSEFQMAYQWQK